MSVEKSNGDSSFAWPSEIPENIRPHCTVCCYREGSFLYQKGDTLKYVYLICKGKIRNINVFGTGDTYLIKDSQKMNFLGDIAFLAGNRPASVSTYALTDCTTIKIPHDIFLRWLRQDPDFSFRMLQHISELLYNASYSRGCEMFYNAIDLVTIYLANYGNTHLTPTLSYVVIDKTRAVLSEELGLTVRTINRAVHKLQEQDKLSICKGKIRLSRAQIEALTQYSNDI